jgi:hypothetical protein
MPQVESEVTRDRRVWKFVAVINFPMQLSAASPPSPGSPFPQSLRSNSRIPSNATVEISGISVSLKKWPGSPFPPESVGDMNEAAALIIITEDDNINHALERIDPILDSILDFLSFQVQSEIRILLLEAIDITPPISEGMERDYLEFPRPVGYPSPRSLSTFSSAVNTNYYPDLSICAKSYSPHGRSALRWYIKAIASPLVIDNFIFLWVALEILRSASKVSIKSPYIATCGHEIPTCPICKQPTSKEETGKSIKKFLIDNLGIKESDANELWSLRQLLHGSNDLSFDDVKKLIGMDLILQEAVNNALKHELGFPQDAPPFVSSNKMPITATIAIGGKRQLNSIDLMLI